MTRTRDTGSISPAVAVLGVALFLLVGLVIDSARVLNERGRATAYAQEAARAGAGAIDPTRTATVLLRSPLGGANNSFETADQRVDAYCAAAMHSDSSLKTCAAFCVDATHVVVHTTMDVETSLLGMIGINDLKASGVGTAQPVQGAETADEPPDTQECQQ